MDREDLQRIIESDAARRQRRDIEEWLQAHAPSESQRFPDATGDYAPSEVIAGASVVTPPRDVRVTARGTRSRAGNRTWSDVTVRDAHGDPLLLASLGTRGDAALTPGASLHPAGSGSVRVTHADGTTEVLPASAFRRTRGARGTRTADTAPSTVRTTAASLPAIDYGGE